MLGSFVTRIANNISLRTMTDPHYCIVAGEQLNEAKGIPGSPLSNSRSQLPLSMSTFRGAAWPKPKDALPNASGRQF